MASCIGVPTKQLEVSEHSITTAVELSHTVRRVVRVYQVYNDFTYSIQLLSETFSVPINIQN
jgi:hypothetical protein